MSISTKPRTFEFVTPAARLHVGPRAVGSSARFQPTRFAVEPLGPCLGAIVSKVDLSQPCDPSLIREIDHALLEYKVLFFRNQRITADHQRSFAGHWGEFEVHPFLPKGGNAAVTRFEKSDKVAGTENVWHSDVSFYERPLLGSVLHAIDIPEGAGDTLWTDMATAYDLLPDDVKELICGRTAAHDWAHNYGVSMGQTRFAAERDRYPIRHHPVVRTHPQTGRPILYVNELFVTEIDGMSASESASLLTYLIAQARVPEYQIRWRWKTGDVAFWDNRATQHYACSDYWPQRRVMERVGIIGDVPS